MVKSEDIPVSVPEMEKLTETQQEFITQLLAEIKAGNSGSFPFLFAREADDAARRDLAYKFLKARRWKLKDAMTMVNNTLTFRTEHGLDEWRLFPCAFPLLGYDQEDIVRRMGQLPGATVPLDGREMPSGWDMCYRALQSSYVNVYHYWDRDGHPVLFDCCGRASVSGILSRLEKATPVGKGLKDVIVPYHTYMNEVQYYMIRYANAKAQEQQSDKKIMGITVVMNAEGMHLGMLQKRFIAVVRAIFSVDQSYYPEVLHRLFVINCPSLIQTVFSLVKGSLDENTRRKVVFCTKSESLEVLRRVMDDDKIPQELGGGCRCSGGCLPRYVDDLPTSADGVSSHGGATASALTQVEIPTEDITIKAGKKLTRDVVLRAGEEVSWQFAIENADVHFSAVFEASSAAGSGGTDRGHYGLPVSNTVGSDRNSESMTPGSSDFLQTASNGNASPLIPELSVKPNDHQQHNVTPRTATNADITSRPVVEDGQEDSFKATGKHSKDKDKTSKKASTKHRDPNSHGSTASLSESMSIKDEKTSGDVDTFVANEDGVLHLLWDNSRSWLTSKKLQLKVFNGRIE